MMETSQDGELLQTLARSVGCLSDAVLITEGQPGADGQRRIIFVNPAFSTTTGFSADEAIGRTPDLTVGEGTDRQAIAQIQRARAALVPVRVELLKYRKDRTTFWAELDVVPVMDGGGRCTHFLAVMRDITERRLAHARMAEANRLAAIGTLLAGVAHEINTPLANVTANLEMIAEEIRALAAKTPSARLHDLETMTTEAREGADRVRKVVRGLNAFSRADEEQRAPIDVRAVLDLAADVTSNDIRHRARLVKDYRSVPLVEADRGRLGQVFINLLVNAAQAIPEGRAEHNEIRLVTRLDAEQRVVIEVRDTGEGIAPGTIARIFEPFFTTKAVGVGTGLGLSICRGIVKGLGGEVTVESQPGKGSVFRVTLPPAPPATAVEEPAVTAPTPSSSPRGPGRRGRVLVVDDDPVSGSSLGRLLQEHDVAVVTSAADALELLVAGERFELILCDLMMPDMTGMDFHAEVKRVLPEQLERIAFITGGAFTPAARAFLDAVQSERLEKPCDAETLRAFVQRFLQ